MIRRIFPYAVVAALCCVVSAAEPGTPAATYTVGETYTYGIFVSPEVSVDTLASSEMPKMRRTATGRIQITGRSQRGPAECLQIEAEAALDGWTKIMNVHLRLQSSVESDMSRSHRFYRQTIIFLSSHTLDSEIDWSRGRVEMTEMRRRFIRTKTKESTHKITAAALDPLSLFLKFRQLDFKPGAAFVIPVTDGGAAKKKDGATVYDAEFRVEKREVLKLKDREYDTFLIRPAVRGLRGLVRSIEKENYRLWISADSLRIPVKVAAEIKLNPDADTVRLVEAIIEGSEGGK